MQVLLEAGEPLVERTESRDPLGERCPAVGDEAGQLAGRVRAMT
jgi:hypothetical protein